MPSPFPGMDPYLEGDKWKSFHSQFCSEIGRYLSPLVRPKYLVRTEKSYISMMGSRPNPAEMEFRTPDVSVTVKTSSQVDVWPGGAAVIEAPLHLSIPILTKIREPQITIKVLDADDQSLVTAIEVLSKSNKKGHGRKNYLAKRGRLLRSGTHLMEIDLLRGGRRMPMSEPLPEGQCVVVLSRADRRPIADVWPVSWRSPLPTVPVPLGSGDPDVPLPLQTIFSAMYDLYSYDVDLRYDLPPQVPVPPADVVWAAGIAGRVRPVS